MTAPAVYDFRQHAPGVTHPALDLPFLKDWINGKGAYANRWDIKYPVMPPVKALFSDEPEPIGPSMDVAIVTKHKCAGPAPYVGRPFCYWWWVGVDELGRTVCAEETTLQYLMSDWEWMMYGETDG
jgi:hypothetical protein